MTRKTLVYTLFTIGILLLEVHTTFPVLWQILGIPSGYPLSRTLFLQISQGFTPVVGVLLFLFAGLIYEREENFQ